MLCAARRSNVCEPAVLILSLLSLAYILPASELLECQDNFYRNTPPHRVTESGLEQRCNSLGSGRTFVSFSHPGDQSIVYTALRLGQHNAWGKGANQVVDKPSEIEGEKLGHVPALYTNAASSQSASPFHKLDARTAEVVESTIVPRCSEAGGSVYVQSGVGGLSGTEGGVLWSAACCDVPGVSGSFGIGVVQEGEEEVKLMSVKELEGLLGFKELFSGGCGDPVSVAEHITEITDKDTETEHGTEEDRVPGETAERTKSKPSLEESANETESSESQGDSVIFYVLSSIVKLLYAPVSPVVSTVTNLPSQICYVLQEDAAVLASLPSDSFSLVKNLGSGVVSGVGNVGSVAYHVGEHSVCSLYTFLSTLLGTLLISFQEGLVGAGMLTWNVLGLVVSALGELLCLGARVIVHTGCGVGRYMGAVGSEMGEQSLSIGQGVGKLAWRGQRGLGHVISTAFGIIGGMLGNTLENIQEAFNKE